MRRAKVRFGLLLAAVSLLVFLILVQQAIQTSLIRSFVGALERQTAPVLVYTADSQRSPYGSVISPDLQQRIAGLDAVGTSGRLGVGSVSIQSVDPGQAAVSATLIGYEKAGLGGPADVVEGALPRDPSEAVGSAQDFTVGQTIRVVPAAEAEPTTVRVVGIAEDAQLSVTPTLFLPYDSYVTAMLSANPDAQQVLPSLIAVRPADGTGVDEVVAAVNAASPDLEALSRSDAAERSPGVAQVRQSFSVILGLYGLVVPLVTGLFFVIITFQKAGALTLLRAIGARAGVLVRALLVQVLVVVGGGFAIGTALFLALTLLPVGQLQLGVDWPSVGRWAALLLGLGVLSAAVSARRVLAIDPVQATVSGGAR